MIFSAASITQRRPLLVLLFVVASLMFLSTVPYWTFRHIELLRRANDDAVEPARELVSRLQVAVARDARGESAQLISGLKALTPELPATTRRHIANVQRQFAAGNKDGVLLATAGLGRDLHLAAIKNRSAMIDAQRRGLAWSDALFMITLISMLLMGWLVWHQRLLLEQVAWVRADAVRAAHDEEELRAAAAAVAAPLKTKEVVRQLARGALRVSNADGAYAAKLEVDGTMRVIAIAGETHMELDETIPYTGTSIEQIMRNGRGALVNDVHMNHNGSRAIVVPMIEAEGPIGVLTLLYDGEIDHSTLPALLARANTFGDLAAVALRKARLLEQSEVRRLQLEAVERSRARLLRGFSHDIKNPLTNADGFLQLLQMGLRGPLAPEQLESVQRARTSLGTGLRLLRDLLDFALASVGRIPLSILPVSICDILHDVVEDHRASAETKHIKLEFHTTQPIPEMSTDVERVRQILDNLLSNAVKYTEDGGEIFVRCRVSEADHTGRAGRWMRIDVSDTGMGIPPEHQEEVFREFTRLNPVGEAGAGIGLAISQWLANALGGKITLVSNVGSGSTFTFWLPLLEAAQQPLQAG